MKWIYGRSSLVIKLTLILVFLCYLQGAMALKDTSDDDSDHLDLDELSDIIENEEIRIALRRVMSKLVVKLKDGANSEKESPEMQSRIGPIFGLIRVVLPVVIKGIQSIFKKPEQTPPPPPKTPPPPKPFNDSKKKSTRNHKGKSGSHHRIATTENQQSQESPSWCEKECSCFEAKLKCFKGVECESYSESESESDYESTSDSRDCLHCPAVCKTSSSPDEEEDVEIFDQMRSLNQQLFNASRGNYYFDNLLSIMNNDENSYNDIYRQVLETSNPEDDYDKEYHNDNIKILKYFGDDLQGDESDDTLMAAVLGHVANKMGVYKLDCPCAEEQCKRASEKNYCQYTSLADKSLKEKCKCPVIPL